MPTTYEKIKLVTWTIDTLRQENNLTLQRVQKKLKELFDLDLELTDIIEIWDIINKSDTPVTLFSQDRVEQLDLGAIRVNICDGITRYFTHDQYSTTTIEFQGEEVSVYVLG